MNNTELYLENTLIELDEHVHFAVTKEFEQLNNPTILINDWSKTVNIPGTAANNKFFGHIYNPDMRITGSSIGTFINFDPTKKLDMRLMYNGSVIMQGYAKIVEIKQSGGKIYYSCTLNGQLGKIFQEMLKIRFEKRSDTSTVDDAEYIIDSSQFFVTSIDCSTMADFFSATQSMQGIYNQSTGQLNPYLKATDIIGFAPNIFYSDDFDYTLFQKTDSNTLTFADTINTHCPRVANIIPGENIYPDGVKPREIGEFRTHLQLPYIYVNKLFQIVAHAVYEKTGYRFILNDTWFRPNNDYWYNYVMTLQPLSFNADNRVTLQNYYNGMHLSNTAPYDTRLVDQLTALNSYPYRQDVPIADMGHGSGTQNFYGYSSDQYISLNLNYTLDLHTTNYQQVWFNLFGGLDLYIKVFNSARSVVYSKHFLLTNNMTPYTPQTGYDQVILVEAQGQSDSTLKLDIPIGFAYTSKMPANDYYSFRMEAQWLPGPGGVGGLIVQDSDNVWHTWVGQVEHLFTGNMNISFSNDYKSYGNIKLSDLWNFEYTPWEILLNYCRQFRILIMINEAKHAIEFIPANKYFENYNILDWTDKLDMKKDFIVTPVYWGAHNVLFNYEDDSDLKLAKEYSEKYGFTFGEKNIITDYKFNSDTNKIFDKIKTSITQTPNVLSWNSVFNYENLIYTRPTKEIYIAAGDEDDKLTNIFGRFYFYCGTMAFEGGTDLRYCMLSDDTPLQKANNKYVYTQDSDASCGRTINAYQKLDIAKAHNVALFDLPLENYATTSLNGRSGIYNNFWKKYIDERYSIQTKKVTCYLDIKPIDFLTFKFNNFIKINNQLYFVNKIYDYDITSAATTKVDLITVNNINNYKTNNFKYIDGKFANGQREYDMIAGQSAEIYIDTNDEGVWAIESPGVFDVLPPSGTGSGSSTVTVRDDVSVAPRAYQLLLYRTDSGYQHLTDIEHEYLTINVIDPSTGN